jgi:hypothetical protein
MSKHFQPEVLVKHGPFPPMSETLLEGYAEFIVRQPLTDPVRIHLQKQWQHMRLAEGYDQIRDKESAEYLRYVAFGIMDYLKSDNDL